MKAIKHKHPSDYPFLMLKGKLVDRKTGEIKKQIIKHLMKMEKSN